MGDFPSGQRGQTVNLLLFSFGGPNPPSPTTQKALAKASAFCNDIRSVPERVICLRHDIALRAMIYASRMKYEEGTDIISYCDEGAIYHACEASISCGVSRISLSFFRALYHTALAVYCLHLNFEVTAMSGNKLLDLCFAFSVAVVKTADNINIPKSSYMIDQFARSGTSVGANIHEAQYAHSKADFIAKLEIALKETNETSYWLKLMFETKRIDESTYQSIEKLCGNIRRLLIASCQTAKGNRSK